MSKTLIEDPAAIDLQQEDDIHRVLGYPPGWALKWGISAVGVAVLLFLAIAWSIQYPDILVAEVKITKDRPPIRLFAKEEGNISHFFIQNNMSVSKGQILAIIDNPANWEDLEQLDNWVQQGESLENLGKIPLNLQLGDELQVSYGKFLQIWMDYLHFQSQEDINQKIRLIRLQLQYLDSLNQNLEAQKVMLSRQIDLSLNNYERNKKLNASGNASAFNVETAEAEYLNNKQKREALPGEIYRNKLQMMELESEIIQLGQFRKDELSSKVLQMKEVFQEIKGKLESWKNKFLITAPEAGTVQVNSVWSPQQHVQIGDLIATIIQKEVNNEISARGYIPVTGSGKVKPGAKVNIFLKNYPFEEFGLLQGKVQQIALIPEEGQYQVIISLKDALVTSYKKEIPFQQELPAVAEIITEKERLLVRIWNKLWSLKQDFS